LMTMVSMMLDQKKTMMMPLHLLAVVSGLSQNSNTPCAMPKFFAFKLKLKRFYFDWKKLNTCDSSLLLVGCQ
jgi:hypothetical protein